MYVHVRVCMRKHRRARHTDARIVPFKIQFRDFAALDPATLDHPALRGNRISIRFDRAGGGRRNIGRVATGRSDYYLAADRAPRARY